MSDKDLARYYDALWVLANKDLVSCFVDARMLNRAELEYALARLHTK